MLNTRFKGAARELRYFLGILLLATGFSQGAHAQIVNDGETNVFDGIYTNIIGPVTVGTNGSFTLVAVTNGAVITNSGALIIGSEATALSNKVVVAGAGSFWSTAGDLRIGDKGTGGALWILEGGHVVNSSSYLGGSNNSVVISDSGSWWKPGSSFFMNGVANSLVITNGGRLTNDCEVLGTNNSLIVTGTNSIFSSPYLNVEGCDVQMMVSKGAFVVSAATVLGLSLNSQGSGSVTTITDPGTKWNATDLIIGNGAVSNLLVISNAALVYTGYRARVGLSGANNTVLVTDPGTIWTNSFLEIGSTINPAFSHGNQIIVSNGATLVTQSFTYVGGDPSPAERPSGNRAVITGNGSTWIARDALSVTGGSTNRLLVLDGGRVFGTLGIVGSGLGSSNNLAIVAGAGSMWTNSGDFRLGNDGPANQMFVTNGGIIHSSNTYVGFTPQSSNNFSLVEGAGSLWNARSNFCLGYKAGFNQLIVTNGGVITALDTQISSVSNKVVVGGAGSLWRTRLNFSLGGSEDIGSGPGHQLFVTDGGTLASSNFFVGHYSSAVLDNGSIFTTNLAFIGPNGTFIMNSGLLNVKTLSVEASYLGGHFVFNGGTLQTKSAFFVDQFVIGNGLDPATFEMLGSGTNMFINNLVVSSHAFLKGVGLVVGNVYVSDGGTVSPGASIGPITIRGNLVLSNNSLTVIKLDASTGASGKLLGITNMTFAGTLQLTNIAGNFTNGSSFKLFSATNYHGAFSSVLPTSPAEGFRWDTNELAIDGVLRVFAVPSPAPAISSASILGGNLIISADGGTPYDPVYVLSTTNMSLPFVNWDFLATNYFDALGNMIFTNPVPTGEPSRYFLLQVP